MSVVSPVIDSIDGATRQIFLKAGVSDFFPIEDIYHEYRRLRKNDENLRKFEPLLLASGNVPKGAGAFTPRYVVLLKGTKIVPFNETLQINQLGDMITDDPDVDPSLYDISGLTVPKPIFIKPSESETIQLNSKSIEFSSFGGGVTIDVINGTAGVDGDAGNPLGTPFNPSNNEADALAIAEKNGFKKIFVVGDIILQDPLVSWIGFEFEGESSLKTLITVDDLADVFNCEFHQCTITGVLDGTSQIEKGIITDLDFVDGYIFRCAIGPGTITLGSSTTANIFSCYSTVPGESSPTINMDGSGVLALRDYNGGMKLTNYNGVGSHSIDLARGQIILDSLTVTSGTFIVRGVGKLVDENGTPIPTGTWNTGVTIINELVTAEVMNWIKEVLQGDVIPTASQFTIVDRITKAILVQKDATIIDGLTHLTE
jgi:hypothetical protein